LQVEEAITKKDILMAEMDIADAELMALFRVDKHIAKIEAEDAKIIF
jgi:hypothetical protein